MADRAVRAVREPNDDPVSMQTTRDGYTPAPRPDDMGTMNADAAGLANGAPGAASASLMTARSMAAIVIPAAILRFHMAVADGDAEANAIGGGRGGRCTNCPE
ncbi:hypothetical protein [Fulvimarina sp. MAC3]|uniref:hypothetical protein n=1 Tax=Fulvimarina sp. MAC3 TaxID=3148887 RepID=UPI0031FCA54E